MYTAKLTNRIRKSREGRRRKVKAFISRPSQLRLLILLLSAAVGVIGGLSAVAFRHLTSVLEDLFTYLPDCLGSAFIVLMPAAGGLIAGLLVFRFAREAKGHGVPEIMEAVALKGGEIRARVPIVKTLASGVTIGSGGSAGSEGPIAQISAGLASVIAKSFKLDSEHRKLLVVCGVAAGISAIFNAPIGGVLFALEVVYGGIEAVAVVPVVLSSVIATAVSRIIMGNEPIVELPSFTLSNSWELLFFLVLGLLLGAASVIWVKHFYLVEGIFDRLNVTPYAKPAIGGLLVGAIAVGFPQILGGGYSVMEDVFAGRFPLLLLLALAFLKMLATSLTLGSGGSGGVYSPSLFIGAMFGGAYGLSLSWVLFESSAGPLAFTLPLTKLYFKMTLNSLFPLLQPYLSLLHPYIGFEPMAYALVGMAACFAASARAPLTAIVMVMEMTGNYYLILPLMAACVSSYIVSRIFMKESIYTMRFFKKGIDIYLESRRDLLDYIRVGEVMQKNVITITPDMYVFQALELAERTHHSGFPVVNKGKLVGIVTFNDMITAVEEGKEEERIGTIATENLIVAYPDETVRQALDKMVEHDVGRLPVVDRGDPSKLLGIITRSDILKAHELTLLCRLRRQPCETLIKLLEKIEEERVHEL
nr:chloride channel protein [Candidatus Freyrarchaeum guaymaensis]